MSSYFLQSQTIDCTSVNTVYYCAKDCMHQEWVVGQVPVFYLTVIPFDTIQVHCLM